MTFVPAWIQEADIIPYQELLGNYDSQLPTDSAEILYHTKSY